jgi:hypothetical protein
VGLNQTSNADKNDASRQADFFIICQKCKTSCCNGARPPITLKRKAIIENYLKKNGVGAKNNFETNVYTFPKETSDNYCVFFEINTLKCRIHPVKPESCVAGPITFDINMKTGKIEWFLKMEKICRLADALFKNEEALRDHLISAKRELLQLVQDLDAKPLKAILKIDELDTFKIGEDSLSLEILSKLENTV